MSPAFQICIVVIGATLAGLNACILFILSDLRSWLLRLNTRFDNHVQDFNVHH